MPINMHRLRANTILKIKKVLGIKAVMHSWLPVITIGVPHACQWPELQTLYLGSVIKISSVGFFERCLYCLHFDGGSEIMQTSNVICLCLSQQVIYCFMFDTMHMLGG